MHLRIHMQKLINGGAIKTKRSSLKKHSSLTEDQTFGVLAEIIANYIIKEIQKNEKRKSEFNGTTAEDGKAANQI